MRYCSIIELLCPVAPGGTLALMLPTLLTPAFHPALNILSVGWQYGSPNLITTQVREISDILHGGEGGIRTHEPLAGLPVF